MLKPSNLLRSAEFFAWIHAIFSPLRELPACAANGAAALCCRGSFSRAGC